MSLPTAATLHVALIILLAFIDPLLAVCWQLAVVAALFIDRVSRP